MIKKNNWQQLQGFTLIEMIIVIVILAIIFASGALLLRLGLTGGFSAQNNTANNANARAAFERMEDELKDARSTGDLIPNTNSITFVKIDGTSVTYALSGGNLMRNSDILATNTASLAFTYLTATNTTTTIAAQVRCIVINATMTSNNVTLPLTTTVCPRNYVL